MSDLNIDLSKASMVLNPSYSFVVRHPVHEEYRVYMSAPACVVLGYRPELSNIKGWLPALHDVVINPEYRLGDLTYVDQKVCVISRVSFGKTWHALMVLEGDMLAEYEDLLRKNVHNVVLVVCASGYAFAVGHVSK